MEVRMKLVRLELDIWWIKLQFYDFWGGINEDICWDLSINLSWEGK